MSDGNGKKPELEEYELPRLQYRLVQEIRKVLGIHVATALAAWFGNKIEKLPDKVNADERRIICSYAKDLGLKLEPL